MSNILHIDTATEVCSVCIANDGKPVILKETKEGRSHASLLTVFIDEIIETTGIDKVDAVAISSGPGSYTGLRIGVGVAKGICYGSNAPLISVPTLSSMFYGVKSLLKEEGSGIKEALFVPMIDARRMEVYAAIFDEFGNWIEETNALIINEETFTDLLKNKVLYFFGSGIGKLEKIINHGNARFVKAYQHSSLSMVQLAHTIFKEKHFKELAYYEPFYLKNFITTKSKKKFF